MGVQKQIISCSSDQRTRPQTGYKIIMARHVLVLLLFTLCLYASEASKVHQKDSKASIEKVEKLQDHLTEDEEERALDADEDEEDFQEDEEDDDAEDSSLWDSMDRSKRPACSNRKCLRWYGGWWADACSGENFVPVAFCEKTGKYCCVLTKPKKSCTDIGGGCTLKTACDGEWDPNGCKGKKWGCCS